MNDFLNALYPVLKGSIFSEILIMGNWDGIIYKKIIEEVMNNNNADKMRIIISNLLSKGTLSLSLINKIVRNGGMVGINNSSRNNIIIIDDKAYVASYTNRYNGELGYRNHFECCLLTDCESTVNEIKKLFTEKWDKSFPFASDDVQGDMV
jgi:hypothetical protein